MPVPDISDIRTHGSNNNIRSGLFTFDDGTQWRGYIEDVAWALKCILEGASQKFHAGCLFQDLENGEISWAAGNTGTTLSYAEAREFIAEYGRDDWEQTDEDHS